jgi:Tat protein translocase TatB subunit
MNLGPAEILVIAVVALLVFGPKRLPDVARQVGSAMRELRKMQEHVKSELDPIIHPDVTPPVEAKKAIEEPDHTTIPLPTIDDDSGFQNPGSFS